jgi:hypothetical protein
MFKNIPAWRQEKPAKKPFAGETEYQLPEKLYRVPKIADLFLLFKYKELPLTPFSGSPDSEVEENSLGTFWFDQPTVITREDNSWTILETRPNEWGTQPEFIQKSNMRYREDGSGDVYREGPFVIDSRKTATTTEYHVGNRIPLNSITLYVPERTLHRAQIITETIDKLLAGQEITRQQLASLNDPLKELQYSEFDQTDKTVKKPYQLLQAGINYTVEQEHYWKDGLLLKITDSNIIQLLKDTRDFYTWLMEQPRVKDNKNLGQVRDLFKKGGYQQN